MEQNDTAGFVEDLLCYGNQEQNKLPLFVQFCMLNLTIRQIKTKAK